MFLGQYKAKSEGFIWGLYNCAKGYKMEGQSSRGDGLYMQGQSLIQ